MEFLVILLPFFLLFFLYYKNTSSQKTHQYPPGPPKLPLIGNLHQIDISCLHECLQKLSRKYGPLMFMKFGSTKTLVVSSARLAEEVMKNQDLNFCSRPKLSGLQKLSYNGLDIAFAPYNQEWREMRKIGVLHLLSMKRVQQFRPILEDEASWMIQKIKKEAESGVVTNLSEILISTASTNICRIAFGKRLRVDDHQRKRLESIVKDSQEMFMGFFFSDYFPFLGWMDHLTGMNSQLEKTFQMADSFYKELIDEHLDPNRPSSMDNDIIDIMLQFQRHGSTSFKITMDHIKAMLMGQDFELIPFGSGRRGCPGIGMGLQMVNLLLANLLHSFDWELPQGMTTEDLDTKSVPGLSMVKENALKFIAKLPSHTSI